VATRRIEREGDLRKGDLFLGKEKNAQSLQGEEGSVELDKKRCTL